MKYPIKNLLTVVAVSGLLLGAIHSGYCADTTSEFLVSGLKNAGIEEHLNQELPLNLNFINDRGEVIRLGDIFHDDKPVIVSMNYSNCPMLCVLQLNGLVDSLQEIDLVAGKDYRIVSVSLQPGEKVEQLRKTKKKYVDSYGKTTHEDGWNFLSGTETAVKTLADTLGIHYVYLPKKKEFSHPAVFCICMPEGKISRYHYGIEFPPKTIRLSLVEASKGKIGTAFDKFLLLCFHYDSTEGRYAPAALRLMKIGGGFTIFGIGMIMFVCHRIGKRKQEIEESLTAASDT